MPGASDPIYVAARRILLDALAAIHDHLDAIVLVGAQAIYLHTGAADLAVAPYTTDGDLAIDPGRLRKEPLLERLMASADFHSSPSQVGRWLKRVTVEDVPRNVVVDLMVPDSLGGGGRRAARIPPHGKRVARKVLGLEGALVDQGIHTIGALDPDDVRTCEVTVAGPSALLVAKIFKIVDREGEPDRQGDKDALDVFRLLRAIPTENLAHRFGLLREHRVSRAVTAAALEHLPRLFGSPTALGCAMAARAAYPVEAEETITASAAALTQDLLAAV